MIESCNLALRRNRTHMAAHRERLKYRTSVQDSRMLRTLIARRERRDETARGPSRCGSTLAVGSRCNVRVSFAPKTAGAKTAKLAVVFALREGSGVVTKNLRGTAVN